MELFRSDQYYIFVRNESSLWWNRITGGFSVRSGTYFIFKIFNYFIVLRPTYL